MSDDTLAEEVMGKMALDDDPINIDLVAQCIQNSSAARGIDYYAVEEHGFSAAEWARMTDRDRSTVATNVRRARRDD